FQQIACGCQNFPAECNESFPVGGWRDVTARPLEQCDVKKLLQLPDLFGQPCLTHAAAFGSAGKIAEVVHRHDIFDVSQGEAGKGDIAHGIIDRIELKNMEVRFYLLKISKVYLCLEDTPDCRAYKVRHIFQRKDQEPCPSAQLL
ncbi:hypothetical protein AD936_06870, partial [Gluconobacter japonicus]